MRIACFELNDPIPECNEAYVIATLWPWIDVNNVGTLVLKELALRFNAVEMGRLVRPWRFYDFTRYRPTIHIEDGIQDLTVPNTTIRYAAREGKSDLILLRLLEPHMHSETYIDSVMKLFTTFKVRKYILIGSMYDAVPHTRPLFVNGYGTGKGAQGDMEKAGALPITYRGPSTITHQITKKAAEYGIETVVFILSLPQYVVLEEDYIGKMRLMEVLSGLYDIPIDKEEFDKALEQRSLINERLEGSTEVRVLLPRLESAYDERAKSLGAAEKPHITAEMEEFFWKNMGKDIGRA